MIKLSFWNRLQMVLFAVFCVLFIIWVEKYAILQSKTQMSEYLTNQNALKDAAVLITIETFVAINFCFTAFKVFLGEKDSKWGQMLFYFPGVLIFPVLYLALTQSIFAFTGVAFRNVTYLMALVVFILVVLGSSGLKNLLPEKEFRLEVHFLVSLFVMAIGLLTTVNGHVTYAYNPVRNNKVEVIAISLFVFALLTGLFLNKLKWFISDRKRIRNIKS